MRLSGKIHNAKSTIILKTGYCVLQIMKHFTLFYFRELTSTFTKLESLVQREMENLEENIIKLDKEITRLEKIENKSIILRYFCATYRQLINDNSWREGKKLIVKWGGVRKNDFLLNPNVSLPPSSHWVDILSRWREQGGRDKGLSTAS